MNTRKWNLNALVTVALLSGLVQAAAGVFMYLTGFYFSSWSMAVTLIVLCFCIVFGVNWYHNNHRGGFGYLQAFLTAVAISVGTGIVYAIYNLISINFLYTNFLDEVARTRMASGMPGSFESIRSQTTAASMALGNLIRLSVLGTVFSAFAALFLRAPVRP
ncbi:MAG TPA: DUF4199 family protein [Pyrinomonadaceae bacterium]|nr:DUF4199 family protein [Pyrinomonadaceae bacterium]